MKTLKQKRSAKRIKKHYKGMRTFDRETLKHFNRRRKSEYNEYIKSDEWKLKTKEAFELYGRNCKRCYSNKNLQVHHMTYNNFKSEPLSDLCVLCKPCHKLYHKLHKYTEINSTIVFCNSDNLNKVPEQYNSSSIFNFKSFSF